MDSTQTEADKIRAKRLAKLGGPSSSSADHESLASSSEKSPAPAPSEGSPPAPSEKSTLPSPAATTAAKVVANPPTVVQARPASPAKRDRNGSERQRTARPSETLDTWQDRTLRQIFRATLQSEEKRDSHGNDLVFLDSTREDLAEQGQPLLLNTDILESAITEAAALTAQRGTSYFAYLLACFKRGSRALRGTKVSGPDDPKIVVLKETRRLCMSYCVFAVTMPEMFGEKVTATNPLVDHLLADPEGDTGICTDFLTEASSRSDEDESIKEALVGAAEELSKRLAQRDMLEDYQNHVRGLRNLLRFPKIVDAVTQSSLWAPSDIDAQHIETSTLLGPFFRISPMQISVASSYFSAPRTRDRNFIAAAQNAVRLTLRTHQAELFQIADTIVRAGPASRERMLNWFALCVNKNHRKRAMRVDERIVSTDGFMVNVTTILDQLCEPFMDASFGKIEKIDPAYLRRSPRVDISDETKINADQKTSDDFYASRADGASNFISEVFFLTVAAHHYGTEAAQTRMSTLKKTAQRYEKELEGWEAQRHKYLGNPAWLARFEEQVNRMRKTIDGHWSTIHATQGVLLDDLNQARSMQFMRYVIVWLLRISSQQDLPKEQIRLPLPPDQPDVFKCLPEYFLEDIVENFKFITSNIPHIITPQQCEELLQICVTFLRSSEYVKNPGVKSGLVTILFYGVMPYANHARGVLGDLLIGSSFAHQHLLHALMKFYIEAESTGTSTQFYDKFNIRYEIFQVVKRIWVNTLYRENLAREASINTDFFVQFVNMLVNDATYVLDESLSSFAKIHALDEELKDPAAMHGLTDEQRKEKQDMLEEHKGRAKSYMQLTRETMETLILFTETLADAFTMREIVTRLADMLDYNLDIMVGPRRKNLKVDSPEEYGFNPQQLLADIVSVYTNLSAKDAFVTAIARDGRSYKPSNFDEATRLLQRYASKSPDEIRIWTELASRVATAKAIEEQDEADLGDAPDEFMDPLVFDLMSDPVILPTSKTVLDRATIRSHLLSDPTDPFNRVPLRIEDVVADDALREKIEAWKVERRRAMREKREETAHEGGDVSMSGA